MLGIKNMSFSPNLDNLLKKQDAKLKYIQNLQTSNGKGKPRQSFDSGLPFKEQSFARMTFSRLIRMIMVMPFLMIKMAKSGNFYKRPFKPQKNEASNEFINEIEELAKKLGAKDIGYVSNIPDIDIFNGLGIPYRSAIVFLVEMDKDEIETAPSFEAYIEVSKGYNKLAEISNQLAKFMNRNGFAAYPGTALGGLTDYVSLAQRAGLGEIGYNGLLLSSDAGPRVRINTIYTNIENLPQKINPHAWVRDFCSQCKNCIRNCPAGAIYQEAKPRETGGKTSIKYESCINYFARDWGCAVCIKVCPFSHMGYEKVKQEYFNNKSEEDKQVPMPTINVSPKKVAVIGAGAAGFYLTEALLEDMPNLQIDLFDKMPVPFGLVRYGVAPDHPNIKSKIFTFLHILKNNRLRYFGNVELGRDISKSELKKQYDAIVFTTGASEGKRLNIVGENLINCIPAPDFIYWYNAHPEYKSLEPDLNHKSIAIIGMGNVSLDITRMLVKSPELLAKTDAAIYAIDSFRKSQIRDIHIIGRGGANETNFTPKELIEILDLPDVEFIVQINDIENSQKVDFNDGLKERRAKRNLEIFTEAAKSKKLHRKKFRIYFHFFCNPKEIKGTEQVDSIVLEKKFSKNSSSNQLVLEVGLVLKSIGYRGSFIEDVPYNHEKGVIPNENGRVIENGNILNGEYTCGWVSRGATGIIGENKKEALLVAQKIIEDIVKLPHTKNPQDDINKLLEERKISFVDKNGLQDILQIERHNGSSLFRAALKFDNINDMILIGSKK